jgi:gliding motility-associated-like protein
LGTTTYTVIGTVTASGCQGTATIDITVESTPSVTASSSETSICQGESIILTGGGADSYVWDGGATNGVAFVPAGVGTIVFNVTGSYAVSGCDNTASVSVTINPNPVVVASATTTEVCFGESVTLTGSGADSYSWDGGIVNGVPYTPVALGVTTYTVTGTTAFGCVGAATITISVIDCEPVVPFFSVQSVACVGACIQITDQSTGAVGAWSWDFGGAAIPGTSTEQNPVICVTDAGSFTIELTTTSSTGALSTVSHVVTVYENPSVFAEKDTIIDLGGQAILAGVNASFGTFEWEPTQNMDCPDCQITGVNPNESTTYTVHFEDQNGCKASDTVMVLVNFVEGVGVPTAFSPNGDGFNDILFIKGYALESVSLVVYNRYGEIVFETTDQRIGWDGTFKNREENPGVFTWVLYYEFLNGKTGSQKGNTTLIR